MVAANVTTARFLEKKGFPSVRRVLRSPERWERIVELARGPGRTQLPGEPDARALEDFLAERRRADPEHFPDLSLAVVKLLGRGRVRARDAGAARDRALRAGGAGLHALDRAEPTLPRSAHAAPGQGGARDRPPPYPNDELAALAQHCTAQEDAAAKVERQVRKSAAALLLQSRIGETFEGFVTGASAKGTWVRVLRPPVEGRVVRGVRGARRRRPGDASSWSTPTSSAGSSTFHGEGEARMKQ